MKQDRFLVFALFLFLLINIVFNFRSWKEILTPVRSDRVAVGDSTLAEFILENNYQNIIHLKNPFIAREKLFYPYDINLSLNDPATSNVLFFFVFRPFLGIHQSMLLLVLLNSFFANLFMYILLRKLKITKGIALVLALSYGFMPVVSYRLLGHYTYTSNYIYPLLFLLFLKFLEEKSIKKKLLLSLAMGIFMALILLHNLYYFITVLLMTLFYSIYYFFSSRELLFRIILKNLKFVFFVLIPFIFILLPWFDAVFQLVRYEGIVKTQGFGGAIELSGDLAGFLTPNEYNPLYRLIITSLSHISNFFMKFEKFYFHNWEKFIYPGIIILGSYFYLFFFRKKIPRSLWKQIKPYFTGSIFFALLTLGPFLKIFNRWSLPLDDGIDLIFPLPFLLLHYIPGFSSIRAPTRFISAFIFLALIVVAYLLTYLFSKIPRKRERLFLVGLFFIFLIDQYYILPMRDTVYFPLRGYNYIKKDPEQATVLEIPFTVRDGFQYIGFVHAISPMNGSFIHKKPVIGGYFARIQPSVFDYYRDLPLIGYIAKIIDKGNYNPVFEKPKEVKIIPFESDPTSAKDEINFLNIKYVLLKNNEKYSRSIEGILREIGFFKKFRDGEFDLYEKKVVSQNFETISFGKKNDSLFVAQGFSFREDGFRWSNGTITKVFFKTNNVKRNKIAFEAESFYRQQKITIYLNYKKTATLNIGTTKQSYMIPTQDGLKSGINTVIFKFTKTYKPSDLITGSHDTRDLAIKLFSLKVE